MADAESLEWQDDVVGPTPGAEAVFRHHSERTEALVEAVEDDDADMLDEESLRDLVREIIRQELQGRLGERITRNVRKLVRAEIARALTSRDYQ